MTSRFVLPLADVGAGLTPSSGAQLFFYETGTTTPKDTYSDSAGTTPNANPVVANSVGVFPDIFISGTYKVVLKNTDGVQQWAADPVSEYIDFVTGGYVSKTELAAATGSGLAGFSQDNINAIQRTVLATLREISLSVKDFGAVGDGVADDTVSCQNAINYAWLNSRPLYFPTGEYLVTGLTLTVVDDDRNKRFTMFGDGNGEAFSQARTNGTWIKSVTDAPVFKIDDPAGSTKSAGTACIQNIYFDGTSNSFPAVHLEAFYGHSMFQYCCILQRGTGNGLQIDYAATSEVSNCYILNNDWASFTLGAARTGNGLYYKADADSGLFTCRKVTCRGWRDPFVIGDEGSGHFIYNTKITDCESSVSYNGLTLATEARNSVVENHYFEGCDDGTGILDKGNYNTVKFCNIFSGYSIGLDSTAATRGNVYIGNNFATSTKANVTLVKLTDSNQGKTFRDNTLVFSGSGGSVAGVVGIELSGTTPKIDMSKNNFDPVGSWTGGSGTQRILDNSTGGGNAGYSQGFDGSFAFPFLERGAISLKWWDTILTESDVAANILTVPSASLFRVNATVATTVQRLAAESKDGRFVMLKTESANMTITDTTYITLTGGASFTGPGIIGFIMREIGADTYAYELFRNVY